MPLALTCSTATCTVFWLYCRAAHMVGVPGDESIMIKVRTTLTPCACAVRISAGTALLGLFHMYRPESLTSTPDHASTWTPK